MTATPVNQLIDHHRIVADEGVQSRVSIDQGCIEQYCDDLRNGSVFPPMRLVRDDSGVFWIWDGFHRLRMYQLCKVANSQCEVRTGTKRDAILLAAGANASHGLPRTREDKERA